MRDGLWFNVTRAPNLPNFVEFIKSLVKVYERREFNEVVGGRGYKVDEEGWNIGETVNMFETVAIIEDTVKPFNLMYRICMIPTHHFTCQREFPYIAVETKLNVVRNGNSMHCSL
ncbi:hypothetical protein PV325_008343, partial [Microctonus aethiopoides]